MLAFYLFTATLLLLQFSETKANEKYNVHYLPIDLVPVGHFLGKWKANSISGRGIDAFPTGTILDIGIDPLPQFGARSLNYTATTYDGRGSLTHFEYGFLMVKNRTRTNPQVLCGLITTSASGYSLVEFGMVHNGFVDFELNNFVKRSFDQRFDVYELRRNLYIYGDSLKQEIEARTNKGLASYSVTYHKTDW